MRKIIISIALAFSIMLMSMAVHAATSGPLIQATFSPNPVVAMPGNDAYLQLTLKNVGSAATDSIKISSVLNDPNIIASGNWIGSLNPLGPGDSTTVLLKFSTSQSTPSGLYPITFDIDYSSGSSGSSTINPSAIVDVQTPAELEVTSISPSSLVPGETTSITFSITNLGNVPISNIAFTWSNSGNYVLPVGSDNRAIIPTIAPGSSYDVHSMVSVSPSATPGVYPLGLSLVYSDKSGTSQDITSTAGLEVGGETDFQISMQSESSGTTTFAIANIGQSDAYSVIVSVPQQSGYTVSGASASNIGTLNAGDYTLASFQITSTNAFNVTIPRTGQRNPNAPSGGNFTPNRTLGNSSNLEIDVSYTDSLGARRVMHKEVTLSASSSSTFLTRSSFSSSSTTSSLLTISNGITYIIIGAVGIAVIVLLFRFRKIFKRKKQ